MDLSERAILVSLKIALPTGTRRDQQGTEDVEKVNNARNIGRFNKDLVNKKFFARIKAIEMQARTHLYRMTVPWGDDDSRLLAVRQQMAFATKMQGYGAAFDTEADAVCTDWDEIVGEAKHRLGSRLFDPQQYPAAEHVRDKFRFKLSYRPVPASGDLRVNLDAEQLKEMKARIEEDVAIALASSKQVAWERLYEKVDHMAKRLADSKGRLHESVVKGVAEVCDMLPDLNFTDDPRLNKFVAVVKQHLVLPVEALRQDPALKESTAVRAKKIADAMGSWMGKEHA